MWHTYAHDHKLRMPMCLKKLGIYVFLSTKFKSIAIKKRTYKSEATPLAAKLCSIVYFGAKQN